MPRIVRVYIRASLVWLLLGMAAFAGHSAGWLPAAWFPVYLHMLTYGWLTQLVFGMGMWMFPLPACPKTYPIIPFSRVISSA